MLLNLIYDLRKDVLVEVDYPFQVQLLAQYVEEHILGVALVEFSHCVCELIEHWKILARIIRALNHRAHLILEIADLLSEFLIFFFKFITFFLHCCKLLIHNPIGLLEIRNFFDVISLLIVWIRVIYIIAINCWVLIYISSTGATTCTSILRVCITLHIRW